MTNNQTKEEIIQELKKALTNTNTSIAGYAEAIKDLKQKKETAEQERDDLKIQITQLEQEKTERTTADNNFEKEVKETKEEADKLLAQILDLGKELGLNN